MVFRFNIEYKTVYGENLVLNLNMDNEISQAIITA